MIDLQTIFICILHISLFYSAAYILFWCSQKTYEGFGCWTLATICSSGVYGAVLLRLVISEGISIGAVGLLIPLSAMLYADGVLRLTKGRALPRYAYFLLLLAVPSILYFYYIDNRIGMRSAVLVLFIAPFNFTTCRALFSYHPPSGRILYLAGGVIFVMRFVGLAFGAVVQFIRQEHNNVFQSPDMGAYLLFILMTVLGTGLFFFMIHAHRFQEEYNAAQPFIPKTVDEIKASGAQQGPAQ